ncbi:hypothetical protein PsorP6_013931 [Peronosclerospora sorghi]|uniref:Uncharacterized protein n=1 Tax=Peronosclerospora sorghi TaxID=230839 RepID=A0ACC0VGV9_9STRA|nr:hypothetical protein PsorP6_013931 [Peronosclerospora sorghi]
MRAYVVEEDSLCIIFAHVKKDQAACLRYSFATGGCPVLALSLFSPTTSIDESNLDLLFPGVNQYGRYRRELRTLIARKYFCVKR